MKYIAVEGPDGTGKTTLAKQLAELMSCNYTYEPSAETEVAEYLRRFCLDKRYYEEVNWKAREYMLLASRAISTKKVRELIKTGHVVSDRSFISGMVYAHVASGMSFEAWEKISSEAFWCYPTHVVHVSNKETKVAVHTEANLAAIDGDIYDDEKSEFHKKITETFPIAIAHLAKKHRIKVIEFENDFNKSAGENALRLKNIIETTNIF